MAKQQEFKFIKGSYAKGSPADICFYTDVDYWSVDSFLYEFDYLVNWVEPSKIRIHINSAGGSVVDGMSIFSKIIDCQIPTECYNDSLAASMGSIIWAAGDELYMKDYALLMIHNPFCDINGKKEQNQATEAFAKQLKTIYMKRFGLGQDDVDSIMDGKEGEDGTFLTAQQAVEKGFIKADHIIETPKAIKDRISAAIKDSKDISQIKAVYGLMAPDFSTDTINAKNNNSNLKKMDDKQITVYAALLGLSGEKATAENVTAKINELKSLADKAEATQKTLDETKAELTKVNSEFKKVNAELTGAQTSVKNLTEDLDSTKAALEKYKEAEAKAQENKVNELIDKAVAECKINKEERELYVKMAQNDFDLAVNVLGKIPARNKLSQETSKANKEEAENGMKSEEQKVQDKVNEVVGKDFKFRSLD